MISPHKNHEQHFQNSTCAMIRKGISKEDNKECFFIKTFESSGEHRTGFNFKFRMKLNKA